VKQYYRTGLKLLVAFAIVGIVAYRLFFAPLPVEVLKAVKEPIVAEVMGIGTLEAHVHATISPKITGIISQVFVDQGDRVVKGQKLLTLDDADLRQQVDMAKAELSVAQAGVEMTVSQIKSAEATQKQAKSSFDRMTRLQPSGAISVDALEKAREQLDVAEARLSQAQTAKIEAEKLVVKNEASLRFAEAQLSYTVVTAPFDGLIVKRYRDPGDTVVPGSLVLDLVSLNELWVSAWVDETMLDKLKVGQIAKIVFLSDPKTKLPGKVVRIAPQVDTETREMLVDVSVDNLPQLWAIGQRAEVYIETGRKENAVVIPQRVIIWRQGQPGVFIIDNAKAYWHRISLGIEGNEKVEVTDGLQAGQTILIPGAKLPSDGKAVKVITG